MRRILLTATLVLFATSHVMASSTSFVSDEIKEEKLDFNQRMRLLGLSLGATGVVVTSGTLVAQKLAHVGGLQNPVLRWIAGTSAALLFVGGTTYFLHTSDPEIKELANNSVSPERLAADIQVIKKHVRNSYGIIRWSGAVSALSGAGLILSTATDLGINNLNTLWAFPTLQKRFGSGALLLLSGTAMYLVFRKDPKTLSRVASLKPNLSEFVVREFINLPKEQMFTLALQKPELAQAAHLLANLIDLQVAE